MSERGVELKVGILVTVCVALLVVFIVLLGGELNAELEHQTRRDTTQGEPEPMHDRGARMADTLGETPPDC